MGPDSDSPTLDGPFTGPAGGGGPSLPARYELLGQLGAGGMGVVHKARDRETGELVAVKVLRPEIAVDSVALERFKNELRLARKITHKNVCRIHEFNRGDETAYITMEFVDGESLRQILKRFGSLPVPRIVQQICAGLREAHAQGVVHRDLKPENVMLDRAGNIKIMDFGIARSVETTATAGAITGTPAYMAPEQAQGKPVDHRADIYALGLVLYEMYTGAAAIGGDSVAAVVLKQISEIPRRPRDLEPAVPAHIEKAILKCIEKDPAKRFQSVEELEGALTQETEVKPVVGDLGEVPLPLHLTRWQRSDWLLVAAAIAGIALFFPFFERTSLAPRIKLSFDRSALPRIGQEYAQRLGAPVGKDSQISVATSSALYNSVAQHAGAAVARDLVDNPIPYWLWRVDWDTGTWIRVDDRGSLATFGREFPATQSGGRLSIEEAKPLAEKALHEFFNRDPALLKLETASGDTYLRHEATAFVWADPNDYQGLKRRYAVRLVGREIASLDSRFDLPTGYRFSNAWFLSGLPLIALIVILALLGFSKRQQVDLGARWRRVATAGFFVLGISSAWTAMSSLDTAFRVVACALFGLAAAVLILFASVSIEWSVCRVRAARFASLVRLFDPRAISEPCGLAILRGTLIGLALLGADAFLVWFGTSRLDLWLDPQRHIVMQLMLGAPWPSFLVVPLFALRHVFVTMICAVFVTSITERFVRRPWRAVLVASVLAAAAFPWTGIELGAVWPYHGKVLFLADCLVLVWTFSRFDVLTVSCAAATFAFCRLNYHLMVTFESVGNTEQRVAFGLWGLFVTATALVAFQTSLRAARQRIVAAFE